MPVKITEHPCNFITRVSCIKVILEKMLGKGMEGKAERERRDYRKISLEPEIHVKTCLYP